MAFRMSIWFIKVGIIPIPVRMRVRRAVLDVDERARAAAQAPAQGDVQRPALEGSCGSVVAFATQ